MLQLEFIGYLAEDAKVIPNNGHPFISFRVAVSRKFKNQQGNTVERTKWIDCTRNGDEQFAQYLKKGQQIYIRGDVDARAYINREGQPAGELTCHVWDTQLLAKPKGGDVPF